MLNRATLRLPVLFLGMSLLVSGIAWAQGGIGEISGFGGMVSIRDGGGTHANFGGTMGANLGRFVHLFGEVNYMSLGSESISDYYQGVIVRGTATGKIMNYGGGVHIRIPIGKGRFEPYGLVTFGYGRVSTDATASGTYQGQTYTQNLSQKENNGYAGFGGGARVFVGKKWGFKPEFRYQRYFGIDTSSSSPVVNTGNVITFSGGIFYQFGGGK